MDQLALLRCVREVAAIANPDDPAATTQRAFDAARERGPNHAGLPPARRITERIGLPWVEVLAVAHEPEARHAQLVGVKTRAPSSADWLTAEHVAVALQLVAARIGADSLTTGEYRVEQAKLIAEDHTRWLHGRWLLLPDDEQVITVAGSWEAALLLAGLTTKGRGLRSRQPRPRAAKVVLTRVEVIERFYDHYGKRPSRPELEAFARGNNLPMRAERDRKWSAIVAEWERLRSERGLPPPRVAPRPPGRPTPKSQRTRTAHYSEDVGAARPGEQHIMGKWTREKCAAAAARYLAQLPNGARSTERGYADWAASEPGGTAPAMSTIQEHGGWEWVRREAQRCEAGLRPD
jgi:hypothetical protein